MLETVEDEAGEWGSVSIASLSPKKDKPFFQKEKPTFKSFNMDVGEVCSKQSVYNSHQNGYHGKQHGISQRTHEKERFCDFIQNDSVEYQYVAMSNGMWSIGLDSDNTYKSLINQRERFSSNANNQNYEPLHTFSRSNSVRGDRTASHSDWEMPCYPNHHPNYSHNGQRDYSPGSRSLNDSNFSRQHSEYSSDSTSQNLVRFDANLLRPVPNTSPGNSDIRSSPVGRSAGLNYQEGCRNQNIYVNLLFDEPDWLNNLPGLANEKLPGIHRPPVSPSQQVENLQRCVEHLATQGVDVSGLDPAQIAAGNLKSTLMLMNNIRKRYDTGYSSRDSAVDGSSQPNSRPNSGPYAPPQQQQQGQSTDGRSQFEAKMNRTNAGYDRSQTGYNRYDPGPPPARTPPTLHKNAAGSNLGSSSRRTVGQLASPGAELLPGSLPMDASGGAGLDHRLPLKHTATMSTTELSSHSVSQKGREDLRNHHPPPPAQVPSQPPRPRSAGPREQPPPPTHATHAWQANVTPTRARATTHAAPPSLPNGSVEQRLKSLISSSQTSGVHNPAYTYEDGELLMPPPPKAVDSSYDDGGMDNRALDHSLDKDIMTYKYEPSRPTERSRFSAQSAAPPLPPKYQPPPQYSPHTSQRTTANGHIPGTGAGAGVGAADNQSSGSDLRNACNKLYGRAQPPPTVSTKSPHPVPSSPYLGGVRSSPMGQSSSSPPSQSSSTQSPSDRPASQQQTWAAQALGSSGQQQPQLQGEQRFGSTAPQRLQGQAIEMTGGLTDPNKRYSGSGDGSRPSSQDRLPAGLPRQAHQQLEYRSRTPSAEHGSHNTIPQEQRPKTPVGSADLRHGMTSHSERDHHLRPKTPQPAPTANKTNGFMDQPARNSNTNLITTSTPKHQDSTSVVSGGAGLSDPYNQTGNKGSMLYHDRITQQRQLLQSQTMVPSTVSSTTTNSALHLQQKQSLSLDPAHWNRSYSDVSSQRSITPPLPPLSPGNSPPMTPPDSPLLGHRHPHLHPHHHRPDVIASAAVKKGSPKKKSSRAGGSSSGAKTWDRSKRTGPGRPAYARVGPPSRAAMLSKPRNRNSVDTVSESDDFLDGSVAEDVTTNADSDGDVTTEIDGHEVTIIRQQLEGLETMYSEILKVLGLDKEYLSAGQAGSRRSISSMSSISRTGGGIGRRSSRHRHGASHHFRRDIKKVNQRFQRLESHVVTLARSVAHLSSEMRSQNTLYQDIEDIKVDIEELKKMRLATERAAAVPGAGKMPPGRDFERFRGWVPSLTNPKRVQKLKRFFGADPPLLHLFLKKLGYERYSTNFDNEGITMVELPYLNEERLQKIGIPMGPRLRILQESQMCFRQDNFDIYIV